MDNFNLKSSMNVYIKPSAKKESELVYAGCNELSELTAADILELKTQLTVQDEINTQIKIQNENNGYCWFCSTKNIDDISYAAMTIDYEYINDVLVSIKVPMKDYSGNIVSYKTENKLFHCYRTTYELKPNKWFFNILFVGGAD